MIILYPTLYSISWTYITHKNVHLTIRYRVIADVSYSIYFFCSLPKSVFQIEHGRPSFGQMQDRPSSYLNLHLDIPTCVV